MLSGALTEQHPEGRMIAWGIPRYKEPRRVEGVLSIGNADTHRDFAATLMRATSDNKTMSKSESESKGFLSKS